MKRFRIPFLLIGLCLLVVLGIPHVHAQSGHNITLTWTAPTSGGAPTTYVILRGTTTGTETQLATVPAPTLTYVDSSGVGGTKYFYEVEAQNSAGTSAASTEVSATFLLDKPGPVGSVVATAN